MELNQYIPQLEKSDLFAGMDAAGIGRLLGCISASAVSRPPGGVFVMQDDALSDISVVVAGRAVGERLQADGSVVTVSEFEPGDVFGDVLSGSSVTSVVSVIAKTDCTVVRFAFDNILTCCVDSREEQIILLRNLINAIADNYFALIERVSILAQNNLRGKIAAYLMMQSKPAGTLSFEVAHNREEMARYLSCERSALSRELSRMADEGFISYERRRFTIIDAQALEWLAQ